MKTCTKCKRDLPLDCFAPKSKCHCKSCRYEYHRNSFIRKKGREPQVQYRVKNGQKICPRCLVDKPISEYGLSRASSISWCRKCEARLSLYSFNNSESVRDKARISRARWRRGVKGKKSLRDRYLRITYGLTVEDVERMLAEQGGCCKICRADHPGSRQWQVDHNHTTERIRGILCGACNRMLGHARDNINTLGHAITYLLDDMSFYAKPSLVTYPPQKYSLENTCPVAS